MWLTAESKLETISIAQANSPYSCFSDLALGGPKVKREDNFGPENSCTYKATKPINPSKIIAYYFKPTQIIN